MIESVENNNTFASLPYGLLISRIIVDSLVDLSKYKPTLIDATFDIRTFSSMRYVLVNDKWYKKESVQSRADIPRATRISGDSAALLFKEAEHIKVRLAGLESHMHVIQDTLGMVLQLHKDSSIDVGKLRLNVRGLKKDDIRSVNKILKEVNSNKTGLDSAHNELAISVHTSYSTFSKIVECSLNTFYRNVLNTLKIREEIHGRQEISSHEVQAVEGGKYMSINHPRFMEEDRPTFTEEYINQKSEKRLKISQDSRKII
ncbi:hypothetical protein H5410_003313 [Solanum commersonii]|uniref:Uncharacterized protein n=1 Tax=Solanum commersonii TaxID=4109 RepID=A0A9J6B4Q9_SOLCO|nr:hypothetical protein H5410_003313 [Solanum commersonii]